LAQRSSLALRDDVLRGCARLRMMVGVSTGFSFGGPNVSTASSFVAKNERKPVNLY
jgi:hypothetical protein